MFQASSAACTFVRAVSSVKGGTGGRGSIGRPFDRRAEVLEDPAGGPSDLRRLAAAGSALEDGDEVVQRLGRAADRKAGDDHVNVAGRAVVAERVQQPDPEVAARNHRERRREPEADRHALARGRGRDRG